MGIISWLMMNIVGSIVANKKRLFFLPYLFMARLIVFDENVHVIFRFYNMKWVFPLFWVEKNEFFTNLDFKIQTPKKIRRFPCFFQIIKSEPLLNTHRMPRIKGKNILDYIFWTVSVQILSLFVTWIASLRNILIILTSSLCFRSLSVAPVVSRSKI